MELIDLIFVVLPSIIWLDSQSRSYMPDLPPKAMHVAAGFSLCWGHTEVYYVPCTHLDLTEKWGDEETQTHLIFPAIDMWWAHHASDNGDKSRASHNFLYHMLPFMAKVVLQDGIYWVEEFPNHEVSLHLIHNYLGTWNGHVHCGKS